MESTQTIFDVLTPDELAEVEATADQPLGIARSGLPESKRSAGGYTLDSTLIVNGVSQTVRVLNDAGILRPVTSTTIEGTGLAIQTVALYEAEFTDRIRSFVITEETYRALMEGVEPHNEEPTLDQTQAIQTNHEVMTADRMSSQESPADAKGRLKTYHEDTRFPAEDQS